MSSSSARKSHPTRKFQNGSDKYPVEEALTAYNSGSPGTSSYSQSVMEIYEKWKELVGDEVSGIKG